MASKFLYETKKSDGRTIDKQGDIEDTSGLSDLEDFLSHAEIRRAVVSYDKAESFRDADGAMADDVENAAGGKLLLIGKGLAGATTSAGKAKRVFLIAGGGLSPSSPGTITIGIRGGISKAVALTPGGSVKNWVNDLNAKEVKDFFKVNEITVESRVGGRPIGSLQLATNGTFTHTQGDDDISNDLGGSFKLTIGEYSHEVILSDGTEADKPFSATNKKAITYVDADDSSEFSTLVELLSKLDEPFHYATSFADPATKGLDSNGKPLVPIGMNNIDGQYIVYSLHDHQPIDKPITVTWENKLDQDGLFNILNESNKDIDNGIGTFVVTLTSDVPGAGDKSTIGHPQKGIGEIGLLSPLVSTTNGEAYIISSEGTDLARELTIGDVLVKSSLPQKGTDDVLATEGPEDLSRIGWL